jgi:hypothetical protein
VSGHRLGIPFSRSESFREGEDRVSEPLNLEEWEALVERLRSARRVHIEQGHSGDAALVLLDRVVERLLNAARRDFEARVRPGSEVPSVGTRAILRWNDDEDMCLAELVQPEGSEPYWVGTAGPLTGLPLVTPDWWVLQPKVGP